MFHLHKIDLLDTFIYADVFEQENYLGVIDSDNLEYLFLTAILDFKKLNPTFKNHKDWQTEAENGGYELELFQDLRPLFRGSMLLVDSMITKAFTLAAKYHSGVKRKGDGLPYLIHILDVSRLLYRNGRNDIDPDVLAASICHDLLEDTECSEKEIEDMCNAEVLRIVKAVSADESIQDWKTKKLDYIESVRAGGAKAQLVCVADKIANLDSLKIQYDIEGDTIWERFNAGKETKKWFEYSVLTMLKEEGNVSSDWIDNYETTLNAIYNS